MYQIKNLLNNKIYVGVHKTKSLDDGYMGSGKIIRSAITKHGISNFSKVILEYFEDAKSMYAKEAEVVNEEFLLREDVYNLRRGGYGGFDYINDSGKNIYGYAGTSGHGLENLDVSRTRIRTDADKLVSRIAANKLYANGFIGGFAGKVHSIDTKTKISVSCSNAQSGEKNSSFGTMWITNELENKKIKKNDLIPEGYRKGRICK
jgi:hypothetical protein